MSLSTNQLKALLLGFVMLLTVNVSAQDNMLRGRVVDEKGQPIVGATILVKGTQLGSSSGSPNGEFSIKLPETNAILDVSFLGFTPRQVSVIAGQNTVIHLSREEATELEAVEIVAVGFGSQKKASVVGAISSVKPQALQIPVRSLSQTLAGNIAGVISLQSSGEPGKDDAQFWIRGIGSFMGRVDPLIIVDGVERPLNDVDPLEIESFSVLKDASATAVFGVRGANGVIIVNTRRGFDGPARIDARYEQGFSFASKRLSFVDAATRSMMFNEAVDGTTGTSADKYTAEQITAMRNQTDPELYPDVDWQNLLMSPVSISEKVSANISGGGRFARYFTALSFYNQNGQYRVNPGKYYWVPEGIGKFGENINYKRYNFRTNVDMNITSTTLVTLGIQGNVTENTEPSIGSDAIYRDIINAAPNAFPIIFKDGKLAGRDGLNNPYNDLTQMGWKKTTGNTLRANLRIDQDLKFITPGLKASVTYAYDAQNYDVATRARTINYFEAVGRDPDGELIRTEWQASQYMDYLGYSSSAYGDRTQYAEATLNYQRLLGKDMKHDVSGLILAFAKGYRTQTASDYINSLPSRSLGLAGRVTYAYDRRYLFEANIGFNGSENFPEGRKMGLFPAVAVGWVLSEESFLKHNNVLTWAKIRGSFGQVGNDQIFSGNVKQRFVYLSTVNETASGYSNFGEKYDKGNAGIGEGRMESSKAQWEVATKYNVGIELGFWNSLTLNADFFYERRDMIFIQPQISEVAGLPTDDQYRTSFNLGLMDNKGFEITGEYSKIFNPNFSLTVRGNFTFARNERLADGQFYPYPWQSKIGSRNGDRLGYQALHLFSQEELDALPDYYTQFNMTKEQLRPGDIRYADLDDNGKIDAVDQTWMGNPNVPEIIYGFGAEMKWKHLDFSFLFQGAGNRSTYLSAAWYFQPFQADRGPKHMGNVMTVFEDRWTVDNPNPNAFSPRLSNGVNANNYVSSTWWLRNSDYLRLKNIEIGYTLPANISRKLSMSTFRVYVTAMNVYTFSKFINKFWDPETGADRYPLQRQVFVGLNLTF